MGYMHIIGEPEPLAVLSPVSRPAPASRCTTATDDALRRIEAAGRKARRALVRNAFERCRNDPRFLDSFKIGLSLAHPACVIAELERQAGIPWGRIDLMGTMSARRHGAMLFARWSWRRMRRGVQEELAHG